MNNVEWQTGNNSLAEVPKNGKADMIIKTRQDNI